MERLSKRAFTFTFVLFTLFLIVSSATDDHKQQADNKHTDTVAESVASVSKVGDNVEGEKSGTHTGNATNARKPDATSESADKSKNCTTTGGKNDTKCQVDDDRSFVTKFWDKMTENQEMLKRTMYVLLGVTGIVVIYFVIRTVRLRRRRSKSRKYGVITSRGDLEMEPLGQGEDEDEDYTVFEMNGRPK